MTVAEKLCLAYKEYLHNSPTKREHFITSEDGTYLDSPQSKASTVKRAAYMRQHYCNNVYVQ